MSCSALRSSDGGAAPNLHPSSISSGFELLVSLPSVYRLPSFWWVFVCVIYSRATWILWHFLFPMAFPRTPGSSSSLSCDCNSLLPHSRERAGDRSALQRAFLSAEWMMVSLCVPLCFGSDFMLSYIRLSCLWCKWIIGFWFVWDGSLTDL